MYIIEQILAKIEYLASYSTISINETEQGGDKKFESFQVKIQHPNSEIKEQVFGFFHATLVCRLLQELDVQYSTW